MHPTFTRRRLLAGAAVCAGLLAPLTTSHAQTAAAWPSKPLRFIVGFPAGSSPDLTARALAEPLEKALGQPVVVENRVGAGGNIGGDAVAKATDSTLMADWKKFIVENGLDWVNAGLTWHVYTEAKQNASKYIPKYTTIESLNYADAWDIYSTPRFFLLDGDRKIVGKQLSPAQVADLVSTLRARKAKDAAKGN